METIIKIELPLKKLPSMEKSSRRFYPWRYRWFSWLFTWSRATVQEFGGSRRNRSYHLSLFRRHVLTIHRNEYHDRTDAERAAEYLEKWSRDEAELRMYRLKYLGDHCAQEVKDVIRESLGLDLDEGTAR
jgi:hypothetical protein